MDQSGITVGPATDTARFVATDQTVWFSEIPAASPEEQVTGIPEDQRFAVDVPGSDPATYPGIYGVFPMTLVVPGPDSDGRNVRCAGLTWVGVHPDHRRKGLLSAMLRHHFEQVRDQEGVHVSALHASEPAIYGRHGYGLASLEQVITLGRGVTLTAPQLEAAAASLTTQFATAADADVPKRLRECHLATAEPGAVVGDSGYYDRVCHQLPEHLRGREPLRVLFARRDGIDVGFAAFRRTERWERSRPAGDLEIWAMSGGPAARLALLRRLVDFDLIGTVKVRTVGVDDPIVLWAGGPRSTSDLATYDSLWVRLVDLPRALEDRAWSAPCDVVVDVVDTAAPWNHGAWRIRAGGDGRAQVERSTDAPDLRLRVEALGGAYLGGGNLAAMLTAGLVEEQRRGSVQELWRALRTPVLPTAAVGF
jgi:GNAT superfamily N-acetyltransferase